VAKSFRGSSFEGLINLLLNDMKMENGAMIPTEDVETLDCEDNLYEINLYLWDNTTVVILIFIFSRTIRKIQISETKIQALVFSFPFKLL
jgi:hypothetical protein